MSIVKRAIIVAFCTALTGLAIVAILSNYIYLNGFKELEKKTVIMNVEQATQALSARIDALNTVCYDWAARDDTYEFARKYNQEYVDRNFQDETFASSEVSMILILNTYGEQVYGKAYDDIHQVQISLPDDITGTVIAAGFIKDVQIKDSKSGVILISGQPMMVVSRQVLNSIAEGPSTGYIIIGRYLDSQVIASISDITHLDVYMFAMPTVEGISVLNDAKQSLTDVNPVFIQAANKDSIAGYTIIKDNNGAPVFMLEVRVPRVIYRQGTKTAVLLYSSLIFIGLAACVMAVFIMRKVIWSRLIALNKSVNKIGSTGDISSRVYVTGNDELSKLAENINDMLESLEKSELNRRSQKELIAHILTNTPNAVVVINEAEKIILANLAFIALFRLDAVNIVDNTLDNLPALATLIPEIRGFIESRALNSRKEVQYRHNGFRKSLVASFTRMSEEKLCIIELTDISEERDRQESMYLTDRLASVGEMVSGIAHELNNPLTSVIGLSEILTVVEVPEVIKEDIAAIHCEAKRAASIVKNMLSFARKHTPQKQFTQINKIIDDVLKLRTYEHNLTNITLEKELDPDLPDILVDYLQIQQVFINIILNAEQAMVMANGKGKLQIRTYMADGAIKISFTDDGPGIKPQHMKRIFDPFFTTKEVGKGTGLGLSICYGIITAHKGKITVKSEVGKGSTFIVELPIQTSIIEGVRYGE